jgi:hypothetical protein
LWSLFSLHLRYSKPLNLGRAKFRGGHSQTTQPWWVHEAKGSSDNSAFPCIKTEVTMIWPVQMH